MAVEGLIKVLIVDDSAVVRQTIKQVLDAEPDIEVCGQAPDPILAMKKMELVEPDVILLDLEMPRMHGLEFLDKIMSERPLPVVVCSSHTVEGARDTIRSLELGAIEIITKTSLNVRQFLQDSAIRFVDAIRSAAMTKGKLKKREPTPGGVKPYSSCHADSKSSETKVNPDTLTKNAQSKKEFKVTEKLSADVILDKPLGAVVSGGTDRLLALGSSTGGPESLQRIVPLFPKDSPGIVLVQHMPGAYTKAFANRLNENATIFVKEAEHGDRLERGLMLVAPGDQHMIVKNRSGSYFVELVDGPLVSRHRPSVDVLFRSVARAVGNKAVGCVMTGMGDDGATGLKEMLEAGSVTFSQDEQSSVVYGMPMQAWTRGAAQKQVELLNIPEVLLNAAKTL